MKSGYISIALSIEDCGVSPAMHQHRLQSRIFMVRSFCSAFGGIICVYERLKPTETITGDYNWCVWAEHWKKNIRYMSKHTTKLFYHMTTLGHVLQNRWKPTQKCSNRKFYSTSPYSPDIAPSNYLLFRSMAHGLTEQHFHSYEDTKNGSTRDSSLDVSLFLLETWGKSSG